MGSCRAKTIGEIGNSWVLTHEPLTAHLRHQPDNRTDLNLAFRPLSGDNVSYVTFRVVRNVKEITVHNLPINDASSSGDQMRVQT